MTTNYSKVDFKENTASLEELIKHLNGCADDFTPPLYTYVDLEEYSYKIYHHAVTFEAWENKVLIGLVAVYYNDQKTKIGFITNVSVIKEKQGLGIAHMLLKNAIEYGKRNSFIQLNLEIKNINNTKVYNLYKNLGFVLIPNEIGKTIMSYLLSSHIKNVN